MMRLSDQLKFPVRVIGLMVLPLMTACSPQWTSANQISLTALNSIDPNALCAVDHPAMTTGSFFVLLGAGLLTGFSHCIGMCGPLVGAFTMRRRTVRQEITTPLVLFQMGRLTTYVLLGALLGRTGHLLIGLIRGWQGYLSVGLGLLMALLGLSLLGFLPLERWLTSVTLARWVSGWVKRLLNSSHPAAPVGLGLANGLLPCGAVYAMALLAAVSGSPVNGAGIMLVFGLGTLPAMLGLGLSTSLLSLRLRSYLYRVAAILVVFVGVQLALRGLAFNGQVSHTALGSVMLW